MIRKMIKVIEQISDNLLNWLLIDEEEKRGGTFSYGLESMGRTMRECYSFHLHLFLLLLTSLSLEKVKVNSLSVHSIRSPLFFLLSRQPLCG